MKRAFCLLFALLLTGCAVHYPTHPPPLTALDSAKVYTDSVATNNRNTTAVAVIGLAGLATVFAVGYLVAQATP